MSSKTVILPVAFYHAVRRHFQQFSDASAWLLGLFMITSILLLNSAAHTSELPSITLEGSSAKATLLGSQFSHTPELDSSWGFRDVLQLDAAAWQASPNAKSNLGISQTPIWFRLDVNTSADVSGEWIFDTTLQAVHSLDMYFLEGDELVTTMKEGLVKGPPNNKFGILSIVHPLELKPTTRYTVLVRVENERFVALPAKLSERAVFLKDHWLSYIYSGGIYGAILGLLIYSLAVSATARDRAYLGYAMMAASLGLLLSSTDGYGAQFIWGWNSAFNDVAPQVTGTMFSITVILFGVFFLDFSPQHKRQRNLLFLATVAIPSSHIGLLMFSQAEYTAVSIFVTLLCFTLLGWIAWRRYCEGLIYARYICMGLLAPLFAFFVALAPLMGMSEVLAAPMLVTLHLGFLVLLFMFALGLGERLRFIRQREARITAEMTANSRMVAKLSHEVRTLLNSIMGASTLLRESKNEHSTEHYKQLIHASTVDLAHIIDGLITPASQIVGRIQSENRPFNLHRCVGDSINMLKPIADDLNVSLLVKFARDIDQPRYGDPTCLQRIIMNCMSSSIRASQGGTIELYVDNQSERETLVTFAITDGATIKGQSEGNNRRSAEKIGAAKAGLHMSKRLLEAMEATYQIDMERSVREAVHYWFALDLPQNQSEDLAEPVSSRNPMRVLLAEDNMLNQIVLEEYLKGAAYELTIVGDGEQALQHYCENYGELDLVLMDCEMPVMDGFESTRKIREFEIQLGLPRMPILAITAHADISNKTLCTEAGMDDMIAKPVDLDLLDRQIASYIQPNQNSLTKTQR